MKQVVIKFNPGPAPAGFAKVSVDVTDAGGKLLNFGPISVEKLRAESVKNEQTGVYSYTLPAVAMSAGEATAIITPLDTNGQPVGASQTFTFSVSLQEGDFAPIVVAVV